MISQAARSYTFWSFKVLWIPPTVICNFSSPHFYNHYKSDWWHKFEGSLFWRKQFGFLTSGWMQCSEGNQRNFDRNRKLQLALFLLEHPYSVHWWWEKDARRQIINEQNWRMIFQRPLRQLRLRPLWNRNWAAQRGRFLHSLHNVTPSMSNLNIGHFLSSKPLNNLLQFRPDGARWL